MKRGEIIVEYLPTEEMWIDVNTKPKQGLPFRRDRAMLMNCPIDLPDETLLGGNSGAAGDTSRKVRFPDDLLNNEKGVKNNCVNVRVSGAKSKTSPENSRAAPTKRLQECVGKPAFSRFQLEPMTAGPMPRGTRRDPRVWSYVAPSVSVA